MRKATDHQRVDHDLIEQLDELLRLFELPKLTREDEQLALRVAVKKQKDLFMIAASICDIIRS